MTVANTARTAGPYTGVGTVSIYPFAFKVFLTSDVLVQLTSAAGVLSTGTLGTDYSVSLNADQNTAPGGNVILTVALPTGALLTLGSNVPLSQTVVLTNPGGWYPQVVSDALDKVTILIQQALSSISGAIRIPEIGSSAQILPAAAQRANKLLSFDAAGNPITVAPNSQDATSVSIALSNYITSVASSVGSTLMSFIQGLAGAVADTVQSVLRQRVSVLDFIPPAMKPAILNYTSTDDHTAYILAAFAAANGRELIVPSGKYNHTELTYAKTKRFHLRGEMSGYDNTVGAVWNFTPTGTSIGLQIGVDDGSPDLTGSIRDVVVEGITFSTATGATAIRVQNTGLCRIERNSFSLFSGKIIDCRANVLLKIRDNDIRGFQPASGNYGIWLDTEYFGNFVTEISGNHIYQLNWAIRFSQGRSVKVIGNTFENVKGWTVANPGFGGMFLFATSGYISNAIFQNNYCESQRGWCFYSDPTSPFTGAILNLVVRGNEFWGSGEPANQNPGFGNLPRNKVMSQEVDSNFIVDAAMNTNAFLALPTNAYFPSTTIFDTTTTVVLDQVTGKEYEDALVYALNGKDLMKANGDFTLITGGTPGSLSVNGSSVPSINGAATSPPSGWTASGIIAGSVWNAILDAITGSWVCFCPGSGSTFNTAQITLTITSNPATTYYAVGFTAKGWAALKLNGTTIYDPGSNVANYNTQVITFSIAPSTTTFNLTLGTNGANPSYWAEMRVFQIGISEYTSPGPGALNGLLVKAVKRLMRRGVF